MSGQLVPHLKNWKTVLCLFLALILVNTSGASSSDEEECHGAHCAGVGEKCTGDFTQNPIIWSSPLPFTSTAGISCSGNASPSSEEKCCGVGLKCWQGRCASNNFGTACTPSTTSQQCFDVSFEAAYPTASCSHGNCRPTQLPGDRCSESGECIGATQCVDRKCTALPLGHSCSYSAECAFNFYCDASTAVCTESLLAGSTCTSNSQCADNYRCHPPSKTAEQSVCLSPFSQREGEFCESEKSPFHFMCEPGLECTLNHSCEVPIEGHSLGASCSLETKKRRDDDDDDEDAATCLSPSTCECNPLVGEYQCSGYYSPSAHAAEELQLLHHCLLEHKCKSAERWSTGTCAATYCSTAYHRAMDGVCPQLADVLGKCAHLPLYADCVFSDEDDGDELTELDIAGLIFAMLVAVVLVATLSILLHRFYLQHRTASANAASSIVYSVLQTELDSPSKFT